MPTLQEAWENFHEGLKSALRQWTALRLAVENNWGGGDSERKAVLLEEELTNLFKTKKELYKDEVEDFLVDYLDDNFSTYAEDDSPGQVAVMLVEMFAQCGRFDFTLANRVREAERCLLGAQPAGGGVLPSKSAVARSVSMKRSNEDGESSSDEDDDMTVANEGGTGMEVDSGKLVGPDPDGWETVPSKRGGKGRQR